MRPLKFAVVREDPTVELTVARCLGARRILLAASGGCTAFALRSALPECEVVLYDFNPTQLDHVQRRAEAIAAGQLARLNVDDASFDGLSQNGDFEKLFRILKTAFEQLVAPPYEVERFFAGELPDAPKRWFANSYWPAVFELAFTDALLVAMFGPDAVQHAAPGSYPRYFRGVFERGLLAPQGHRNPFLQHVFLGRYRREDAPAFLLGEGRFSFSSVLGGVPDVPGLETFDLVHLSNIFDWSDETSAASWCGALRRLRPGAAITVRQLNNQRDWLPLLAPHFRFDHALGAALLEQDRSLFYNRIIVAFRTDVPA